MKSRLMSQQVILRSFLWLIVLCAVLIIGITGCGNDDEDVDNEWVGAWNFKSVGDVDFVSGRESAAELGISVKYLLTFNSDGTWQSEVTAEIGGAPLTHRATGTYSLSGANYTMSGTADIFSVAWAKNEISFEEVGPLEDSGTWVRKGGTLTLTNDDGTVIVLKK